MLSNLIRQPQDKIWPSLALSEPIRAQTKLTWALASTKTQVEPPL